MSKLKHLHALIATITVALEYDPADIAALTTLNAQVREAARKLTGFRDIEIRLGKIPAPTETVITEPLVPKDDEKDLVIPTGLVAKVR